MLARKANEGVLVGVGVRRFWLPRKSYMTNTESYNIIFNKGFILNPLLNVYFFAFIFKTQMHILIHIDY